MADGFLTLGVVSGCYFIFAGRSDVIGGEKRHDHPISAESLYGLYCGSCHGEDGKGSEQAGKPILGLLMDFDRFADYVGDAGHEPVWRDVFSDEELYYLYLHIRGFSDF